MYSASSTLVMTVEGNRRKKGYNECKREKKRKLALAKAKCE